MSIFAVYRAPADKPARPGEEHKLLRDKFSWGATLVPPLWAMVHGLWVELIIWIAGMIALGLSSFVIGDEAMFWLYVLLALLIGFEATSIRAKALTRKGWTYRGEVVASSTDSAELAWLNREAKTAS